MKKRILALLLVFALCFCMPCFAEDDVQKDPYADLTAEEKEELNGLMFSYYESVMRLIDGVYRNGDISVEDLYGSFIKEMIGTDPEMVESAVKAATKVLDDNSFYMTMDEYEQYYQHLEADYCGIGVIVTSMNGPITITGYAAEKTPAKTAGLLPGDIIVSIDGVDVTGMTAVDAGDYIKGDKGTVVKVGIKRNDIYKEFDIVRDDVEQVAVAYTVEEDCMYIKLSVFSEGSSEKMAEVLKIADARKIKKIILDLRDNGGGIGTEAFAIASLFLPKNKTITTITYNDESLNEVHKSTSSLNSAKYQAVVLVNENSASCSEMVAGALQDHGIGYLIGTNTYGKSTGQQVYPLNALDGYLKLTVSRYYTPSGNPIPGDGIVPDRYIKNKVVPLNLSEDFHKISFDRKPVLGDSGEDIIACKERFSTLGYYVGDTQNPEFDILLEQVVKRFQADNGLYSYGVLDNATMLKLYNLGNEWQVEEDTQLETAYEYFKKIA